MKRRIAMYFQQYMSTLVKKRRENEPTYTHNTNNHLAYLRYISWWCWVAVKHQVKFIMRTTTYNVLRILTKNNTLSQIYNVLVQAVTVCRKTFHTPRTLLYSDSELTSICSYLLTLHANIKCVLNMSSNCSGQGLNPLPTTLEANSWHQHSFATYLTLFLSYSL